MRKSLIVPQDFFPSRAKDSEIYRKNLDNEMSGMLNRNDMPSDVQFQLYNNLSQRYNKLKEHERRPIRIPIVSEPEPDANSNKSSDIKNILETMKQYFKQNPNLVTLNRDQEDNRDEVVTSPASGIGDELGFPFSPADLNVHAPSSSNWSETVSPVSRFSVTPELAMQSIKAHNRPKRVANVPKRFSPSMNWNRYRNKRA